MLTKPEIINLRNKFRKPPFETMACRKALSVHIWENDDLIGFLKIDCEDGDYFVEDSRSTKKGVGKLLYYWGLHLVHPNYLRPDLSGFSDDAAKVWKAFDSLDYVESKTDPIFEVVNPSENDDNYSHKKYKFTFKNETK